METKTYTVKGASRFVGVIVGLAFVLVGVLLVVVLNNWLGTLPALVGLIAIWAGVKPNQLVIGPDAIENRSLGTQRYPYSEIRRVRMVARKFYTGRSRTYVGTRVGGSRIRVATSGRQYRMYPEIQVEGDFKFPLILEMEYTGQLFDEEGRPMEGAIYRSKRSSRFNTQEVMRDLLDRLPPGVDVDSSVQAYAATRSIAEITTLPQENPRMPIGAQG